MANLLYFLIVIFFFISMAVQANVTTTFNKYSKVPNKRGYTGAEVASMLLERNGITDVVIEPTKGNLTDHYDPTNKVIRLSESVYSSRSVAALGVAAHETGHAIQHNLGYTPYNVRAGLWPVVSFSNKAWMPIFFIGVLLASLIQSLVVAEVGAILFAFCALFHIVTLPVEINASARALRMLDDNGFLSGDEVKSARSVLSAAAMTYVAAAIMSLLQLLRLLAIINSGRRRN
jgi:hypothetical protein